VFNASHGRDWVGDFRAGAGSVDVLDVSAFGFVDLADLLTSADDEGGSSDVVIMLDASTSVKLAGVRSADLHENDFLFG
jgi:hypothetical protein